MTIGPELLILIRSAIISLCIGIISGFLVKISSKVKFGWIIVIFASITVILTIGLSTYSVKHKLVEVPILDNLSKADAEISLQKIALFSNAKSFYNILTMPGRVIPASQYPSAGLKVYRGTTVSFNVSIQDSGLSLISPIENGDILLSQSGLTYHGQLRGKFSVNKGSKMLLWVHVVKPFVPNWFLMLPPNGITSEGQNGDWQGTIQVGNEQYPPANDQIIDIAASLVDAQTESDLIKSKPGQPMQQPMGRAVFAKNVKIRLEQ